MLRTGNTVDRVEVPLSLRRSSAGVAASFRRFAVAIAGFNILPVAVQIGQARRARQYLYLYVRERVPMGPSGYWGDSFGGIVGALDNGAPAAAHLVASEVHPHDVLAEGIGAQEVPGPRRAQRREARPPGRIAQPPAPAAHLALGYCSLPAFEAAATLRRSRAVLGSPALRVAEAGGGAS